MAKAPPDSSPAASPNTPRESSPTAADRLTLIGNLQSRALSQPDPLTGNLDIMSGDVMLFASRIREAMEADLLEGKVAPQSFHKFTHKAELFLKFARQAERLAQVRRQLSSSERETP
jgi:hypothetical protein